MHKKPILAITLGDPGGIGPEIIAKALAHAAVYEQSRPLVIGERRALEAAIKITGRPLEVRAVEHPDQAGEQPGIVDMIDLRNIDIEQVGRGHVCAEVGKAGYEYLERAAHYALNTEVAAGFPPLTNPD